MQQCRVIGIPRVFRIELPVAANALAHVAHDLDGPREQPVDGGKQRRVEICLQSHGVRAERGEDHALVRRHAQSGETMFLGIELGRVAAHPRHAAAVGNAHQVAAGIVSPLMIDAFVLASVAARLALHRGAAVGAPVHQGVQAAVLGAADDDRRVAHERRLEVVRLGDLRFQRHVVPDRAAEDGLLLAGEHVGPRKNLERHAAAVAGRPGDREGFTQHRHPPWLDCRSIDRQTRAGCFAGSAAI